MQFEYASTEGNNKLKEIIRKFTATQQWCLSGVSKSLEEIHLECGNV